MEHGKDSQFVVGAHKAIDKLNNKQNVKKHFAVQTRQTGSYGNFGQRN
jgi:hypothetical protein